MHTLGHVLVTGGTGSVGRFVVADLLARGHRVTLLGRSPVPDAGFAPWVLGAPQGALPAADALVHCALDHLPGRYRGGEGADPEGYWARNVGGSLALFAAARDAAVPRGVFLSSRAVYGDVGDGAAIDEAESPAPDTLYGQAKRAVERALPELAASGLAIASIRATGVCGLCPGAAGHKWAALFAAYLRGAAIAPRVASEVHGADLADAVRLLLTAPAATVVARTFNASDLLIDLHDLLGRLGRLADCPHPPPPPADRSRVRVMACDRLRALGWVPRGDARLEADLPAMAALACEDAGLPA